LGPLALVVVLSILKELYDDILRHRRDREINGYQYGVLTPAGFEPTRSGDLMVGMVVEVRANERIPADMVVLFAEDEQGNVFIRTDQLDGETDWKLRKAVKLVQQPISEGLPAASILEWQAEIKCAPPIENIYQFSGVFVMRSENKQKESLSLENVAWASTVLANGRILGLVIHTGRETRMAMNSR
jgi:phospholipid-translocating ATPase